MNEVTSGIRKQKTGLSTNPIIWISLAVLLVVGLIFANAHLVFVAVNSQPDCVVHDKVADETTSQFRAAKSVC